MPESPLLILVSCSPGAPSPIILVASVQGHARPSSLLSACVPLPTALPT